MRTRTFLLAAAATTLVMTGCGGQPANTASETDDGAVTVASADREPGEVLVDGDGMTLYLFDRDSEGESACTGGCAETWPPLFGTPTVGPGADSDLLGTVERPDGTTQATYGGHPLYLYAPDQAPGDVTGQGVGEVWWVISPDGTAIRGGGTGDTATPEDVTATPGTSPAY